MEYVNTSMSAVMDSVTSTASTIETQLKEMELHDEFERYSQLETHAKTSRLDKECSQTVEYVNTSMSAVRNSVTSTATTIETQLKKMELHDEFERYSPLETHAKTSRLDKRCSQTVDGVNTSMSAVMDSVTSTATTIETQLKEKLNLLENEFGKYPP
jgi:predicted DNA-binding protein YlxM (UPF0122 family)